MTAALEGGEWSAARPDRTLPPGKNRYPLYRRLGGSQGRSGLAENLVPTGIRSRTFQPVASRYTDQATRLRPRCPEGSRKLRFPDYVTMAQDGGKIVSLTYRMLLPPGNIPGTHFCYRLSLPQGHSAIGGIMSMKNSNDTICN